MSKVNKVDAHNFVNGEIVQDVTLNQVVELLRVANNDTYDRLIKQYQIIDSAGAVKGTQLLDTILNTLKLKEGANIVLQLDPVTSTVTIAVSGVVLSTAFDFHKTSTDHDSRYYTEAEMDLKLSQVSLGNPADRSIPAIKLQANTITAAELSTAYAKGAVNGVASLGADGMVPLAQLPTVVEIRTLRLRSMFK